MNASSPISEDHSVCNAHCEQAFVHCTARMPTGCVEALRLCREQCPPQDRPNSR